MNPDKALIESKSVKHTLVGKYSLVIHQAEGENILEIIAPDGNVRLSIRVTPNGPILYFDLENLKIQTSGSLELSADYLAIHTTKGITLSSNGDIHVNSLSSINTKALAQNISASKGNVNIKANDDVKLDGERIRMNC